MGNQLNNVKSVSVGQLTRKPSHRWRRMAGGGQMVITRNGQPIAILTPTDSDSVDEDLDTLMAAKAQRAIRSMRQHAKEVGLDKMTMAEIDAEIAAVRRGQRQRRR